MAQRMVEPGNVTRATQSDMAVNQMAHQMVEPGNIIQAAQSDVAANQMAHQMAEPGDMARAPIKMVGGKPWSPGVYRALQLLRNLVEVAWKQAFVRILIFNQLSLFNKF